MMKVRIWIYLIVLAAAILALIFWLRSKQRLTVSAHSQTFIRPSSQLTSNEIIVPPNAPTGELPTVSASVAPTQLVNPLRTPEGFQKYIEEQNAPIDFYGQIIDQYSNPVAGVKVDIGIRHWTMPEPDILRAGSKEIYLEQTSDTDGRFEFHGETGDGFGVVIAPNEGYLLSPKAPKAFAPSAGSFEKPVIFKMWKESAKEPLIGGNHIFGIDTGKAYTLNLITGKKIDGEAEGDLRVTITRPNGVSPHDKFPWSFSIEAMQGGFAKPDSNDEFMFAAPESGYQPKIEIKFDPSDPSWAGIINREFFFTSRNGQVYGRVKIEVDSIYNVHSAIQIDYVLNPNGSRDLQP